jgi:putative ABC transport system permease protein
MITDLRHAVRALLRRPGFSIAVVSALALGIGVNTTIFSLVDGLLFRPLPIERMDEVVRVAAVSPGHPRDFSSSSFPVFADYRDQARSFAALAAFSDDNAVHVSIGRGAPERLSATLVTGRYFEVLGTRAQRGRLIGTADDRPDAPAVIAISDGLWRRVFDRRAEVVGQMVRVNGHPFVIAGVAPPGLVAPTLDALPDLWVPMAQLPAVSPEFGQRLRALEARQFSWLSIVGRLAPGATVAQAQAELDAIARARAATQLPNERDPFAAVVPVAQLVVDSEATAGYRQMAWVLLAVVGLVLLLACADAASLLLVRADERRREMAIRAAMGSTRWRLTRLLLTEGALLAMTATALGLLLAVWTADALTALLPADFPLAPSARGPVAEPRVLVFAVMSAITAACLFSLVPAWRASRPDLVPALKQEPSTLGRRRALTVRHAFVAGQVALCTLLLVGAGLLLRTVQSFGTLSPGFETSRVLVASVDVALQGYDEPRARQFFEALQERVTSLPGVTHAGLGRMVPVYRGGMRVTFEIAGEPPPAQTPEADFNPVSRGFLAALDIPLVAGRDFAPSDTSTAPLVVIVNQALADRYFDGGRALGRRLRDFGPGGTDAEIVGITGNARYRNLRDEAEPMIYTPHAQSFFPRMSIVLGTRVPADTLRWPLAEAIASLDADLPVFQVRTMPERLRASLAVERLLAWLLSAFAALAVFLAAAGLYGVISYTTILRTREFGVRIALGATARRLRTMVVGQALWLVLGGLAVGLAGAAATMRLLEGVLFGVRPIDLPTFAATAVLLVTVGVLAAQWPARRAARVDPMKALKTE